MRTRGQARVGTLQGPARCRVLAVSPKLHNVRVFVLVNSSGEVVLDTNLTWTSLVPQLFEEFLDVGGDGGGGFEVLTVDTDGDVLEGP